MKKIIIAVSFFAALVMSGCRPETRNQMLGIPDNAIMLSTENFSGNDTKTAVSYTNVQWVTGDKVYLNNAGYAVTVDNNGNAYVNASEDIRNNEAFGYHGMTGTPSWASATKKLTATIPAEYTSSYDAAGRQVIALPMVAYKSGAADNIEFKHVTSAVRVRVKNTTGTDLMLDSVIVTSETQKLNGSTVITLTPEDFAVPAATSYTASTKRVIVYFIDQPIIATGGSDIKEIQVPILPISEKTNDLSIKVFAHKQSGETVSIYGVPSVQKLTGYSFSKKDNAPELPRNTMVTAQIEIKTTTPTSIIDCSLFSVASGSCVRFSKGNLQYIGSASPAYWKFADNQYGFIGVSQASSEENIDRDLFGWGTSGYSDKNPYMVSTTNTDYGSGSSNINNTDYDWGKYNEIQNGGVGANLWRTLTDSEWKYLFQTRFAASQKYGFATVNGIHGLIILPNHFVDPRKNNGSNYFVSNTGSDSWTSNVYSASEWAYMESAGAIFLPAAGRRSGTTISSSYQDRGYYWSTTASGTTSAKYCYFYISGANSYQYPASTDGRNLGCSVRLVQNE